MKLPNGYEAIQCLFPEDWTYGEEKVLCGCNLRCEGVFPFIKSGRLWIRVRHVLGGGFCEFEAISDKEREARAGRELPTKLRSR